jgi:hypothetical protein
VEQTQKPISAQTASFPGHQDFPKGWRWLGKVLVFYLMNRNRRRVLRAEKKRLPVLESAIATLAKQKVKAHERGLVHVEQIHNVGLYLLLMDRDFAVLKVDMVSTFEDWRLKHTARQMGLLLYEVCDDLSQMLGKNFRASLAALEINDEEMKSFDQACKRLHQFKKTNYQFLYNDIRNLVAGHRAQDSLEFLKTIEQLDAMKVFRLGAEFFEINHQLIAFLILVATKMGRTDIALKQLLASPKFMATIESK